MIIFQKISWCYHVQKTYNIVVLLCLSTHINTHTQCGHRIFASVFLQRMRWCAYVRGKRRVNANEASLSQFLRQRKLSIVSSVTPHVPHFSPFTLSLLPAFRHDSLSFCWITSRSQWVLFSLCLWCTSRLLAVLSVWWFSAKRDHQKFLDLHP